MSTSVSAKSEYKHLNRTLVDGWVKRLLATKGSEGQIDLLKNVRELDLDGEQFSEYIEQEIANGSADPYESDGAIVPSLGESIAFEPEHMYMMPAEDIVKLYSVWSDIPIADAASPTLWGTITLSEIRHGTIKPAWLAVGKSGGYDAALGALDKALLPDDSDKETDVLAHNKSIDDLVRRVLRWMMGPGQMRGRAELYSNCSLAKAWWCGWLAEQCTGSAMGSHEKYVLSFKAMWLELADYISGKLTVVSEQNVANGLALWAEDWLEQNNNANLKRTDVRKAIHELGKHSAWSCLGLFPPDEIKEIIRSRISLLPSD